MFAKTASCFKENTSPDEPSFCDFLSSDNENFTAGPEKTMDYISIDAISETLNKEVRANKLLISLIKQPDLNRYLGLESRYTSKTYPCPKTRYILV
jgi:hypothetical protein